MEYSLRSTALAIFVATTIYFPSEIFAEGDASTPDLTGHSKPIHTHRTTNKPINSKRKTVVTPAVQNSAPVAKQGILHKLYGMPSSNSVRFGALVYHMAASCTNDCSYTYPYAALTIHNVYLSYFNNTFHRNTYGVGMERTWFKKSLSKNLDFNVNYMPVIFLGGYCIKGLSCKHKSLPVVPAFQVLFAMAYKKYLEVDLSWVASVVTLECGYRFD